MLSTLQPLLVLLVLPLLVPALSVLLLLRAHLPALHLPSYAGITDLMVIAPRSVKLPAPVFSLPAGTSSSSLIYLLDLLSSRRFLVDSSASVSVFPSPPSASSSSVRLVTADGSSLTCSGSRIMSLWFGSHMFDWPFQLALVSLPILGVDFLCHHCLFLDVANQRVFFRASPGSPKISLASSAPSSSGLSATLLSTPHCISELLSDFSDFLSSDGFTALPPGPPLSADTPWSSSVC